MSEDWKQEAGKAIAAATPGPWEFYDGKVFGPDRNILMTGAHMRHTDECQSCRDVKFAVVARTALPQAIKDLQEAWKANGELEAELERHATDRVNQSAELARKDAEIAELRDSYTQREPCGHAKNFLIGDEHGHFTCTVCQNQSLRTEIAVSESEVIKRLFDQHGVECGNCGTRLIAQGGSLGEHHGLSSTENGDLALCGHCMGLEASDMQRQLAEPSENQALRAEVERLDGVLWVIERVCGDDFCEDLDMQEAFHPEDLTAEMKTAHAKLSAVYRASHSAVKTHSCFHVHGDWRAEVIAALSPAAHPAKEEK